jgi:hypothetical protein
MSLLLLAEGKPIPNEVRPDESKLRHEVELEDDNTAVGDPQCCKHCLLWCTGGSCCTGTDVCVCVSVGVCVCARVCVDGYRCVRDFVLGSRSVAAQQREIHTVPTSYKFNRSLASTCAYAMAAQIK